MNWQVGVIYRRVGYSQRLLFPPAMNFQVIFITLILLVFFFFLIKNCKHTGLPKYLSQSKASSNTMASAYRQSACCLFAH